MPMQKMYKYRLTVRLDTTKTEHLTRIHTQIMQAPSLESAERRLIAHMKTLPDPIPLTNEPTGVSSG